MTEEGVATPEMWAFVEERRAAATEEVERIAWENVASILTHIGRFTDQLRVLQTVALTEVAFAEHPPRVQAQWVACADAAEAFLVRFPPVKLPDSTGASTSA